VVSHGRQTQRSLFLPFGPSQMRGNDDLFCLGQEQAQGGKGPVDSVCFCYFSIAKRDVEVDPHENSLVLKVELFDSSYHVNPVVAECEEMIAPKSVSLVGFSSMSGMFLNFTTSELQDRRLNCLQCNNHSESIPFLVEIV